MLKETRLLLGVIDAAGLVGPEPVADAQEKDGIAPGP